MMKTKLLLFAALLLSSVAAEAQWKVGLTAGADYNIHSMDLQYMNDVKMEGRWGVTMGVTGQYQFLDWLGVRADLNWTQKNYRQHRVLLTDIEHKVTNDYLQLPVMASMSFGCKKVRGFVNLGVYGGYWLSSHAKGKESNFFSERNYNFSEKMEFNDDRDQRWDCGFTGGIGIDYRLSTHWGVQAEARYYYSTTSTCKQYMRIKDYRYNSTTAIQIGAYYEF